MTHDTAPVLCTILKTARIIDKRSTVDIELKDTILELPRLWPLDTYFRLVPSPKRNAPPILYTCCGYDFNIHSPKGHVQAPDCEGET